MMKDGCLGDTAEYPTIRVHYTVLFVHKKCPASFFSNLLCTQFIRQASGYDEIRQYSRAESTWINYTDWSSQKWREFHSEFFRKFAERYNGDPRIAFLEACNCDRDAMEQSVMQPPTIGGVGGLRHASLPPRPSKKTQNVGLVEADCA
jgi:hypothetical protein